MLLAVVSKNTASVELLLDFGANLAVMSQGLDEFMIAIENGETDIVRIFIKKGVNVNTPYQDDKVTPLMLASGKGYLEIVKMLLEHGADPLMKDTENSNAYTYAMSNNHPEIGKLLMLGQ